MEVITQMLAVQQNMVSSQAEDSEGLPYLQNHLLKQAEEGKNKFMKTLKVWRH
jgi:hypothetical protein